jgi:hypothetical protein
MIKLAKLWLIVMVCTCITSNSWGQGPGKGHHLGKSKDVLDAFKKSLDAATARKGKATIPLKVSESLTFNAEINFQKNTSEGLYLVGAIDNYDQSDFFITVNDHGIEGNIILRKSKKAYKYYQDQDGNAYVNDVNINEVVCIEYEHHEDSKPSGAQRTSSVQALTTLESLPGANGCVLLDFDGQVVSGTRWNNGATINAAPSGMSDAAVQETWEVVSEDYRPFNVNITTNEAVFNSYPKNRRMRCIITPTNTAAPGAGGVAYISSFSWNDDTPCWVFILSGKSAGEASSHEIGHTLSLGHDGRTTPAEGYYQGHGSWAPIMGVGYYKTVTQWSKGEYANSNNKEDDLSKITSTTHGLGYRNDDHANVTTSATALNISSTGVVSAQANKGLIERQGDVDMFKFTTSGGAVNLTFSPAARYANLDILVNLYNSAGAVISTHNPTGLSSSISTSLAAGTYYLSVDGTGALDPATTGYSDYASLGMFTISGTIPVSTTNQVPAVSITSPANGSLFNAPATINIIASATDNDGTISKVEFYNGSTKIGEDLTAPYTFSWTNVAAGNYSLTARATDNAAATTTSAAVSIQVVPANNAPVVSITSPVTGASYNAPATINITANASDNDGTISKVEFYNGTTLLGTAMVAPYSFSWTNVPAGNYSITAIATDNSGNRATSAAVTVQVLGQNVAPIVNITSPVNGASFNAPATINITANASDSDGTISKVEFYNGATKIGEDLSAPYTLSWSNVTAGNYTLTAKAFDNGGLSATSSSINVSVQAVLVYCASRATNSSYEHIANVTLGAINNTSGNNGGYRDFTSLVTTVNKGSSYTIYFRAGFPNSTYTEFWTIWIDFNRDGDFIDAGETIAGGTSAGTATYSKAFVVPTTAATGKTRMRVSMKYQSAATACQQFTYGEVEDYTLDISGALAASNDDAQEEYTALPLGTDSGEDAITVHPNPAKEYITINQHLAEGTEGEIVDMNGSVVKNFISSNGPLQIDVKELPAGIYIVKIKSDRDNVVKRFVKI